MIQKIVGLSFNPTKGEGIEQGTDLKIWHDDENQYSSRAIAVSFNGTKIGHIGEKGNEFHERIFKNLPIVGKVKKIARLQPGEVFSRFREGEITHLEVEFPLNGEEKGIKAFNAPIYIDFDEENHTYRYKGQELIPVTSYIEKWIKGFDKENIAAACARSWGTTGQDVLGMWEGGGNIASNFGTVIHKALEHYEKYKVLGQVAGDKKGLPNKALPSHPLLCSIIEKFLKKFPEENRVASEALLVNLEKGICGTADRIVITGDKKCKIRDFKITKDPKKKCEFFGQMAELPKTNISKWRIQLSTYARILELSGWEVEDLEAYVFKKQWSRIKLKRVKVDF